MNFIEAVKELDEGRCEGIRLATSKRIVFTKQDGYIFPRASLCVMLRDDWELVNPKSIYEEVEVVKYLWITHCGTEMLVNDLNAVPMDSKTKVIKLTGTIKTEIKPKVKRKLCLSEYKSYGGGISVDIPIGKIPVIAEIFAEWEE